MNLHSCNPRANFYSFSLNLACKIQRILSLINFYLIDELINKRISESLSLIRRIYWLKKKHSQKIELRLADKRYYYFSHSVKTKETVFRRDLGTRILNRT